VASKTLVGFGHVPGGLDDGEKRVNYQSLPSLDEYLLLNPDTGEGTLYRRSGASWTRIQLDRGDPLELRSVGLQATMAWLLGSCGADTGAS
jgi:Uma2 family endonuclease